MATLVSFVTSSCGSKQSGTTVAGRSPLSDLVLVQSKDLPPGLDLRVSHGRQGPPSYDRTKLAPATKLSDAEAEALLSRARPLQGESGDAQPFAFRPRSQPAPRTGKSVQGQFPAPPSSLLPPAGNEAGKDLQVLRWMPEGEVPLAPELSVTFSQPMIAVTSQTDAAANVPIKLTPTPAGRWRWIGTRTVVFDPGDRDAGRFPQATTYQVEVPAGTKSATGGVLKDGVKFTFETPAPALRSHYPSEHAPQRLDVPMFALFDQKIVPAAMLKSIAVTANGARQEIRLLDAAELARDKQLKSIVDAAEQDGQQGRWVAFRAASELPTDAAIEVTIDRGAPSAEGPNRTPAAQRFSFRTFPPLRIEGGDCGYRGTCPPGTPLVIKANNPLNDEDFDESLLVIRPEIPDARIEVSGPMISIIGSTTARTRYEISVSGKLLDVFGQRLGKDAAVSIQVTDATPVFFGPDGLVVADPAAARPTLDVFTTNYTHLKVKLYQVSPSDFDAYGHYLRNRWNHDKPPRLPGKLVFDQSIKTTGGDNQLVETAIDLSPALRGGLGHAIAVVEPSPWTESYDPPRLISWVQATRLGVDAYIDADNLIAHATELATGKPASGVALELMPFKIRATSDAGGLATLPLHQQTLTAQRGAHYLIARRGDDVAFVSDEQSLYSEYGSWTQQSRGRALAWYLIDDRKLYKPGEELTLKGWLRIVDEGKNGDVGGIAGAVDRVAYVIKDARGNEIAKGSMPVSAVGGFHAQVALPKTPNLGYAYVELMAQGRMPGAHYHSFQIEEFRRPEFAVSAQASQGPFLVGGGGDVTVEAKYYAGGPLPGAPVQWEVQASKTNYTPPNRGDYVFGEWLPWWGYGRGFGPTDRYHEPKTWTLPGKTDATGAHTMHLDFLSLNPAMPMSVTASASVTDVNRQTWAASSALIVHPSQLYVGLKTKKPFVAKGAPFEIDVIGVDLDGKAAPGTPIEVRAVRLEWEYKRGRYTTIEVDPQTCSVVAAADPVPCKLATTRGGQYQVTATIADAQGRPNQTKLTFWVSGGDRPPARAVEQEQVQVIPDKKEYRHGDTAELLIQAPFYPAEGLVSYRRSGIVKTERISMTGPTTTIQVPITDAMVPNLYVQVDLVGAAARIGDRGQPEPDLPKRPAYAMGEIDLPVPPKQRTLSVEIAPNVPKLGPGEAAKLGLIVKDAAGRPVANADAAVLVVDEAVLAMTGYQHPDPIDAFYSHRDEGARDHHSRGYVKLARPTRDTLASSTRGRAGSGGLPPPAPPAAPMAKAAGSKEDGMAADQQREVSFAEGAPGNKNGAGATPKTPIAIRSNFNPLAAFAPAVKTDASGRATVEVKVPDNLTRYRIVA
ncbi:MAG: Ig-like domain-containing protein, partial [Kofleriaceae bacterium]